MHTSGNSERSRRRRARAKPCGALGEHLERVGVERARPPASRRRCWGSRRARAAPRARGRARCGRDVVGDDRHRARRRRPPGSARRSPLSDGPHVVRHDDERADDGRDARERLRRARSSRAVLFVPVPTISGAPRAPHTREHASMTARFSSASSAVASPVVPSATMPADAGVEVLVAEALDGLDVDRALRVERRDERDPDTAEIEIARHALKRSRRPSFRVGEIRCPSSLRRRARRAAVRAHGRVGVRTGVLSGMFGIGGAVVSTPAIRALGATRSRRSARRCRRSCRRRSRARCATTASTSSGAGSCSLTSAFGVPASVAGSRLSRRGARQRALR